MSQSDSHYNKIVTNGECCIDQARAAGWNLRPFLPDNCAIISSTTYRFHAHSPDHPVSLTLVYAPYGHARSQGKGFSGPSNSV